MDSSDKDAVDIFDITTEDLQYYISLVDKVVAGFERINSNFERSSTIGKICCSTASHSIEKSFMKEAIYIANLIIVLF
jgi:hypothetical protein